MFAYGFWLLLANFAERRPKIEPERMVGFVLVFLALMAAFHGLTGVQDLDSGLQMAEEGRGGGVLGALLIAALLSALGGAGAAVALLAWILVGLTFSLGLTVSELLAGILRLADWLGSHVLQAFQGWQQAREAQRSSPTTTRQLVAENEARSQTNAQPVKSAPAASATPDVEAVVESFESGASKPKAGKDWSLPDITTMLERGAERKADETFDRQRAEIIEETLDVFGAPARVIEINRGPTITQFGVEPEFMETRGGRRTKVKVSKITSLADDLALALAAASIRIEAPVPGKGFVGIEVPNTEISLVALRDVVEAQSFKRMKSQLRLGLGQDVSGHAIAADLTAMPHLLIAGTTGSGKSVCVNSIVACLLLQNTPEDMKLLMIDPKRVELTFYNGVPHLLAPVVVDLDRVVSALQWVSREMDERYRKFSKAGVRNIADYNQRMRGIGQPRLPYLVVVIDELADLMMMSPDETERVLARLAQLARATGIHLVVATQRPSVDVVTGLIKANFPARIAFAVASSVDSRVILDQPGAERLLGRGDMLYQAPDAAAPVRMQGAFVSESELNRLIRHWKNATLSGEVTHPVRVAPEETIPSGAHLEQGALWDAKEQDEPERDELYDEALKVIQEMGRASISLLQRRLRIGYTRAARLIDQLEAEGAVGPAQGGSQARDVLVEDGQIDHAEEEGG
jgi:S-DNA-T family DNA segregation ATPase FtsK/SpoIIIE